MTCFDFIQRLKLNHFHSLRRVPFRRIHSRCFQPWTQTAAGEGKQGEIPAARCPYNPRVKRKEDEKVVAEREAVRQGETRSKRGPWVERAEGGDEERAKGGEGRGRGEEGRGRG